MRVHASVLDEVERAWTERRSIRAYRDEPIAKATLERIFGAAQSAPSWCNVQPWRVAVTMPPATAELATALQVAAKSGLPHPEIAFPLDYPSPYKEHRNACAGALYTAMGIARENKAGRYDAWLRNYALFDAPHVAIVSCDKRLGTYPYVDIGIWLGYVLTGCAALGVDTCPMASVAAYPEVLRARLPIAETETILFGVVMGYADPEATANAARTSREPTATNVTFVDGE